MTVQNLEEKAELNETIERLKAQFTAVSNNLEVQTADNAQLSRYACRTGYRSKSVGNHVKKSILRHFSTELHFTWQLDVEHFRKYICKISN